MMTIATAMSFVVTLSRMAGTVASGRKVKHAATNETKRSGSDDFLRTNSRTVQSKPTQTAIA